MLNPLRRRPPPPRPAADDGYLACYGIVVACASLLLLVILAATVSIGKACALAGAVAAAFGLMGCLYRWCADDGGAAAAGLPPVRPAATGRPRGGVPAIDVLPAFAYATDDAEGGGSSKAGRRRALCSVCLEHVRAGETVRQLPACRHLFHVGCIDMWLHSHRTCPLCRCDAWAQPAGAKPAPEAEPPDNSDALALPPV